MQFAVASRNQTPIEFVFGSASPHFLGIIAIEKFGSL